MSQLTEKPTDWKEEAQFLAEVLPKVKTFCEKRREIDRDDVAVTGVLRIISENLQNERHELERLRAACELTLLFHGAGPWDDDKRLQWANKLTFILGPAIERAMRSDDFNEATTRNLCNAARAALKRKSMKTLKSIVLTMALAAFTLTARAGGNCGVSVYPTDGYSSVASICDVDTHLNQTCYIGIPLACPNMSKVTVIYGDCPSSDTVPITFKFSCQGQIELRVAVRPAFTQTQTWWIFYDCSTCQFLVNPGNDWTSCFPN